MTREATEVECGRDRRGQGWTGRKAFNTKDRLRKITEVRRDHGPVMDRTQSVNRSVSGLEAEEGRLTLNVGGIPWMESSGAAPPSFLTMGTCDQVPHFCPHALPVVMDHTLKLRAQINFFSSVAFASYFIRRDVRVKPRMRADRWERSARTLHGPS